MIAGALATHADLLLRESNATPVWCGSEVKVAALCGVERRLGTLDALLAAVDVLAVDGFAE
jgi:hypothetical protein